LKGAIIIIIIIIHFNSGNKAHKSTKQKIKAHNTQHKKRNTLHYNTLQVFIIRFSIFDKGFRKYAYYTQGYNHL